MTETVLQELLRLRDGLAVRVSLLREDVAAYFEKDQQRLERLIAELTQTQQTTQR